MKKKKKKLQFVTRTKNSN